MGGCANADGHFAGGTGGIVDGSRSQGGGHTLCDQEAGVGIGVGKHDHELFPTVAGDGVGGSAKFSGQDCGERSKTDVALRVAQGVVEEFEVIYIDEQEGKGLGIAQGALPLEGEGFIEPAAIVDAGEGIAAGELFKLEVGGLQCPLNGEQLKLAVRGAGAVEQEADHACGDAEDGMVAGDGQDHAGEQGKERQES